MQEPSRSWTVAWIRERVKGGHHRALTKYLLQRTQDQAMEAMEAGIDVPYVMGAFDVKNGQIAVPDAAIKVLRGVEGAHPSDVWRIVAASDANDPAHLKKRMGAFKRAALAWAQRTGGDPGPWINQIIVHEIHTA